MNNQVDKMFIEAFNRMTNELSKTNEGIQRLNDSNVLHNDYVEKQTLEIRLLKKELMNFLSFNKYLLLIAFLALVVLSGAEKVIEIIK
jgi:hypothetical protein